VSVSSNFLFFLAVFYTKIDRKPTKPILTHDGSYDAVSRKELPFRGYKIKFNILGLIYFFHKNMINYNGAYVENWTMF